MNKKVTQAECIMHPLTGIWLEETEAGSGGELNGSKAECARAGLASAGLSPSSGIHLPVRNLAGLGAGASMSRKVHAMIIVYNDTLVINVVVQVFAFMCVSMCVCVFVPLTFSEKLKRISLHPFLLKWRF